MPKIPHQLEANHVSYEVSDTYTDLEWDRFLERTPIAQFQQSSAWSFYKKSEGWEVIRTIIRCEGSIIGGFQVLWKKFKGKRVAYLSKGPVIRDQFESLSAYVIEVLKEVATSQRFTAVIVQAPDDCALELLDAIDQEHFISAPFLGIIDSTLLIKLDSDSGKITNRFRKSTRSKYNKAVKNGLTFRAGTEEDLPTFFELMRSTCERQGVSPSPPSLHSLKQMWASLRPQEMIEIAFAEIDGELVSGQLLIGFNGLLSLYKTGWAGAHRALSPPSYVICEILKRNSAGRYLKADFSGLERRLAETLLKGDKISQKQNATRDAFKLGFGGQPKLLPTPYLWVPNPLIRICARATFKIRFIRSRLSRIV